MWCKWFVSFFFIFLVLSTVCYSQLGDDDPEAEPSPAPTVAPGVSPGTEPKPTPEPYQEDEFPQWVKDLRRAEVIIVGSIPFTMFYTITILDYYQRFNLWASNDFAWESAPWSINSQNLVPYNLEEKVGIVITAVSFSVCIAIIDYIIVRVNRNKKPVPKPRK